MNGLRLLRRAAAIVALLWSGIAPTQPKASVCPPPPAPPGPAWDAAAWRAASDRGFLWRIAKGGRESWLYGTLHLAQHDWMAPGPRVRAALATSNTLALELDMLDDATAQRLATEMARSDSAPLPRALQRRLERRARAECTDPASLRRLSPELQLATLTMLAARRRGLEAAYGIDLFLARLAHERGMRVVALETPQEQLRALRLPDAAEAVALLDGGLAELDNGRAQAQLARLADTWASGDLETLARYPQWCDCLTTPAEAASMRRLLDDRNPALARHVDALHQAGARLFVAVGALHMIGPSGLPALLARSGYRVERIRLEDPAPDIVALWDFDDPAGTEARLRARLEGAGAELALSLRTQIARTHSLRGRFAEAHALLDEVDAALPRAGAEPRVRAWLERGRTWRSSGQPQRARPLFLQAAELAGSAGLEFLAVDALHMLALVETDTDAQLAWNRRALAAASRALDPRARDWDASLANNIGISLHQAGRHEEALASFRTALAARERIGKPERIRVARWMIAWTLRAMQRHDEALALLRELDREQREHNAPDGYVAEEIAENLLARGDLAGARPWFARAHALLSQDRSPDRPDAQRLARLLELSR